MAKILVIDDHPELRELFRVVLRSARHTVITAADGASGLARYAQHRPAIVITDLDGPRISGLEVIEQLRGERVQIIAISGSDRQSLTVARELGATVTLKKPFGLHDLTAAVRRLVVGDRAAGVAPMSPSSGGRAGSGRRPWNRRRCAHPAASRSALMTISPSARGRSTTRAVGPPSGRTAANRKRRRLTSLPGSHTAYTASRG